MINIPSSYNKANIPKPHIQNSSLEVNIKTNVINIDSIDTVNMIVTLTMELRIKWYDQRLTFSNPNVHEEDMVPAETAHQLWTPLRNLIHENAIIGEIKYDNNNNVKLQADVPEDLDVSKATENRLFKGSNNSLELSQRMKINYNCLFNVQKFPFDGQNCYFIMKIIRSRETTISFVDDGYILYDGSSIVDQFTIGKMNSEIKNTNESTKYIIVIPMNRIFTNQLLTTFIPTCILWLFGYATLFIDTENPSDRFMGAGTALLVTATLLNAISGDLPKTSYMKFIDLWFVWHVVSIFAMIIYHIILNSTRKYFEKSITDSLPFQATRYATSRKVTKINNIFIIVFPILNSLFYGIYFCLTM